MSAAGSLYRPIGNKIDNRQRKRGICCRAFTRWAVIAADTRIHREVLGIFTSLGAYYGYGWRLPEHPKFGTMVTDRETDRP